MWILTLQTASYFVCRQFVPQPVSSQHQIPIVFLQLHDDALPLWRYLRELRQSAVFGQRRVRELVMLQLQVAQWACWHQQAFDLPGAVHVDQDVLFVWMLFSKFYLLRFFIWRKHCRNPSALILVVDHSQFTIAQILHLHFASVQDHGQATRPHPSDIVEPEFIRVPNRIGPAFLQLRLCFVQHAHYFLFFSYLGPLIRNRLNIIYWAYFRKIISLIELFDNFQILIRIQLIYSVVEILYYILRSLVRHLPAAVSVKHRYQQSFFSELRQGCDRLPVFFGVIGFHHRFVYDITFKQAFRFVLNLTDFIAFLSCAWIIHFTL